MFIWIIIIVFSVYLADQIENTPTGFFALISIDEKQQLPHSLVD